MNHVSSEQVPYVLHVVISRFAMHGNSKFEILNLVRQANRASWPNKPVYRIGIPTRIFFFKKNTCVVL